MRSTPPRFPIVLLLCVLVGASVGQADPGPIKSDVRRAEARGETLFEQHVRPLLVAHCYECHSAASETVHGGLLLDSRQGWQRGGDSGAVIVPGKPDESLLLDALRYDGLEMPPAGRLKETQIAKVREWIKLGAFDPRDGAAPLMRGSESGVDVETGRQHWAYRRWSPVAVPNSTPEADSTHPIDRFIDAELRRNGIEPAPRASRHTLLRRASYVLTGLPPIPDDIERLTVSDDANALESEIERLLESPHYGERWARHWLDIARFAESNGYEVDRDRKGAYRFRDFVIRALNDDMPFDQFVRWQVAGDAFAESNPDAQIATGFLVAGSYSTPKPKAEIVSGRYDELDDILSTLGSALLGMTIGCARCHDHKYDPVSQQDYYSLLSHFGRTDRKTVTLPGDDATKEAFVSRESYSRPVHFLIRGDWKHPREAAEPSLPAVLMRSGVSPDSWSRAEDATPRQALARWLTDAEDGAGQLLARVIVNRLWQHHFGRGLVDTPSDFGYRGATPTHPELLDWLAQQLVANDWRLKPLHRLIMTSEAWQRSARASAALSADDAERKLLARRVPLRLEAESIRDAMLVAAGILDRTLYGPGTFDLKHRRRSIYFTVKRTRPIRFLRVFNAPDALQSLARRSETTVPLQSLLLMNSPLVFQYAEAMAARIDPEGMRPVNEIIGDAFLIALGRLPTNEEAALLARFVPDAVGADRQVRLARIADLCHTLFCSNEFVYVE